MADIYDKQGAVNGPAIGGFAITKSDATVFSQPTKGLWVGSAGDVNVRFLDGTTGIIPSVPAGTLLPVRVDKVLSASTSAGSFFGLY